MGASKRIKQIMIEKDISVKELSQHLDFVSSPQALSNKLYKDNFSFSEVEKITNVLGAQVQIIIKDSGKQF